MRSAALLIAVALASAGCPAPEETSAAKSGAGRARRGALYPGRRIGEREVEAAVMALLDKLRSGEYMARVGAQAEIERRVASPSEGGEAVLPYVVPLLSDPHVDVRLAAFEILAVHGRNTPEAVRALVEAVADPDLNAITRNRAAEALERWTANGFGFSAWARPSEAEAGASKWKAWLERTRGVIPPAKRP
jgi:hypothetical protein